jgi:hypothetical protein
MKRIISTVLSLALATATLGAIAAPAFADEHHAQVFPMSGEAFQQKVEARLTRQKARLEERIAKNNVDAERAKVMRERFEVRAAKVRAAMQSAIADGVVTAEEAKAVREAGGGHPHHGHHHGDAGNVNK